MGCWDCGGTWGIRAFDAAIADDVAAAVNAAAIASPLQSEMRGLDAGCLRHGSILEH